MLINVSPRKIIALGLAGTMAIAIPAALGSSSAQPANKAVASGSTFSQSAPGTKVPLLTATFKTSKPEDLLITASLECSILTSLTTNSDNPSADAQAAARVWIEIDGKIVPVTDASAPPQDPSQSGNGTDADKVTFCNREYQRSVTDQENPMDGQDEISDFISTKSAHAFSWVRLNTGSGDHTAVLYADLTTSQTASATATLDIGNRTLIIEPTKLANNAVIN